MRIRWTPAAVNQMTGGRLPRTQDQALSRWLALTNWHQIGRPSPPQPSQQASGRTGFAAGR